MKKEIPKLICSFGFRRGMDRQASESYEMILQTSSYQLPTHVPIAESSTSTLGAVMKDLKNKGNAPKAKRDVSAPNKLAPPGFCHGIGLNITRPRPGTRAVSAGRPFTSTTTGWVSRPTRFD
ncbi:hypothetical protein BS78_10G039200 [Paspalum vaginatum]|nr:hypothetical protein BS78_10G039200 [Paspalum vaginatum]